MKIVFIADCLTTQKAGIHYYARQFIKRTIATYSTYEYYHITSEDYPIEGSKNIVVPISGTVPFHYRLRYFTIIPKRVNWLKPDVAIEMAHFGPFLLHKAIRRVTVVHDLTPIFFPQYHDKISVLWHKYFFKSILERSNHIITNSQVTKADVADYFGIEKKKITVAYPSVKINTDLIEDRIPNITQFITVGTIEPRKRHIDILDALEMATSQGYTNWKWVIVGGSGWSNDVLLDRIEKSPIKDKIEIKGYLSERDVEKEYMKSDYLVYASEYEGFGMPIIEAMSYGVGLVLSDIKIHREVARDCAYYFSDAKELSKMLFNLSEGTKRIGYKNRLHEMSGFILPFLD